MAREIEQKMINFLDAKLSANGLAQHAIDIKDARLLFGLAAEACVGIKEQGGNNRGPMVELMQKTIEGADREPWCMAFVQTCLAYAELRTGKKSPIVATEHCMTAWRNSPQEQRVKTHPLKYAIIIWNYDGTDSGHTGVIIENNRQSYLQSVEGNTGDESMRDGDGVFYKKRDWIRTGSLRRVGFLKPF